VAVVVELRHSNQLEASSPGAETCLRNPDERVHEIGEQVHCPPDQQEIERELLTALQLARRLVGGLDDEGMWSEGIAP
jgi:ribosome maturation factor RimP